MQFRLIFVMYKLYFKIKNGASKIPPWLFFFLTIFINLWKKIFSISFFIITAENLHMRLFLFLVASWTAQTCVCVCVCVPEYIYEREKRKKHNACPYKERWKYFQIQKTHLLHAPASPSFSLHETTSLMIAT